MVSTFMRLYLLANVLSQIGQETDIMLLNYQNNAIPVTYIAKKFNFVIINDNNNCNIRLNFLITNFIVSII